MSVRSRSTGAVIAALLATGVLATPALGDQCPVEIVWEDVRYELAPVRFDAPEPGPPVGDATVPRCPSGGRCAPPEKTVTAYRVAGVPPTAALVAPGHEDGVFLAHGTFAELPGHPLHEAVYGTATNPDYARRCSERVVFHGVVDQVAPLRVEAEVPDAGVLVEDGRAFLSVDAGTRIEGFDRAGIPTLAPGDEVFVRARLCGDGADLLAERIEPAGD
ncbi:MAG TPA: hypothetical protein VD704_11745 [Gaiellaceae bacterium]|nr:hypothetical protein [Gaiellaceae bacterium]